MMRLTVAGCMDYVIGDGCHGSFRFRHVQQRHPVPPAEELPETRRPTGVARLHSRRGGTNQYRQNGANYEYQGWAKLDDRSGPGLMIELISPSDPLPTLGSRCQLPGEVSAYD